MTLFRLMAGLMGSECVTRRLGIAIGLLALLMGGCASGEREAYYRARGRVVAAGVGDGSTLVAVPSTPLATARAGHADLDGR